MSQTIAGDPGALVLGDSLTREVAATIDGTAPMVLPDLMTLASIAVEW